MIDAPSVAPIVIVATGATVVANEGVVVNNGGSARIRGLTVIAINAAVSCGAAGQTSSKLRLEAVSLAAGAAATNLVNVENCATTIDVGDLDTKSSSGNAITLTSDASVDANRVRIRGGNKPGVGGFGTRMGLRITNSLLENPTLLLSSFDTVSPGSSFDLAYSTVLLSDGSELDCSPHSFKTIRYDDNVVFGGNTLNVVSGSGCTLTSNVLFPQMIVYPGNINANPKFVDANGDFHLSATSPALDAAVPTALLPSPTPDFDGTPRPQGPKADIGAFERKP